MAGVTVNGFEKMTFDEMMEYLRTQYQSENSFGPTFGFDVGDAQYHLAAPMAMALATLWDVAEVLYNNNGVDQAEGIPLDNKVKDNGIKRNQAVKATGAKAQQFLGTDGTIIPIGFVVLAGSERFQTTESGTISSGTVNLDIEAVVGGTDGNRAIGTITSIEQPLSGLTSTTNTVATTGGLKKETDEELKVRNLSSLAKGGGSTTNSVRASILQVSGVTSVVVRNNETLLTVDGVPPKAIAPVVQGGDTEDIQDSIYAVKGAGIECFGSLTKNYTDDNGNTIVIGITRPTEVDSWIRLTVTHTSDYPADGDTQVRDIVVNAVNSLNIGNDVVRFSLATAVGTGVPGITNLLIETSLDGITYNESDLTIAALSVAVTDNSKVTVI